MLLYDNIIIIMFVTFVVVTMSKNKKVNARFVDLLVATPTEPSTHANAATD